MEEHDQNRTEWVEFLRATPDVVRHPPRLKPGNFRRDQYWFLVETERADLGAARSHGSGRSALS